ncbi:MAG: MATE family efflux transporter [Candidatus Ventricola sp.]
MNQRIFLRYVAQNIAGMIGLSCYILVDTLFVSMALGASGLAALNLAITVFSVVTGIGQLVGAGGGTDFSLRRAEGREADRSLPTALLGAGAISLLLVLVGVFFAGPLSRLLGADEATLALTTTYVRMTLLFSPVYILCSLLRGFVCNDGSPNLAMLSMLVSSGLNIALDYLFLFPLGMGMFGAVLATGMSACLSLPVLLVHFSKPRCTLRLSHRLYAVREMLRLLAYGLSALVGELASAISLLTFNLLLMRLSGYIGVAAYGVIANTALVATSIFTGVGQGIQPLASRVFGADDHAAMRRLLSYTRITVTALSLIIFALVFLFAQPLAGAFNHEGDAQLLHIAVSGLRVYFTGYLFAGVNIAAAALLSAVGCPRRALLISLLRSCVLLVPAALLLSHLLGVTGVWLSFVATEAVCCVLSLASVRAVQRA